MAGISDSGQPDDKKLHIETIIAADTKLGVAPEGETEERKRARDSERLPPWLRKRADKVLVELQAQVPGLTAAETAKLLATQEGRDALAKGEAALARVDSHLQSVTGERNPIIGKSYGVYGDNPEGFTGVYRALELSVNENAGLKAKRAQLETDEGPERAAELAAEDLDLRRTFTPVIDHEVQTARDQLARLITARHGTRADLSQALNVKGTTMTEADAVIRAVREHLYANLPKRKQDERLRDYGYRPLKPGRRGRKTDPAPAPVNPVTE
jgi:hypothetical protein